MHCRNQHSSSSAEILYPAEPQSEEASYETVDMGHGATKRDQYATNPNTSRNSDMLITNLKSSAGIMLVFVLVIGFIIHCRASLALSKAADAILHGPETSLICASQASKMTSKSIFQPDTRLLFPEAEKASVAKSFSFDRDFARRAERVWSLAASLTPQEAAKLTNKQMLRLFPETYSCNMNDLYSLGGQSANDGSYWICTDRIDTSNDCTIVSVGSKGWFSWELDMIKKTEAKCKIHVLDCTGDFVSPDPNIIMHKWCLGKDELINGLIFKTWNTIISELKIKQVQLLKIDIEGWEWVVMPELLETAKVFPRQVAIEMHIGVQPAGATEP
ncbi:hypothetical protein HDU82_001181, partial [Entophlyctis luteolus]